MTADGPVAKTADDIFRDRKVVLVAVPGAFTPTCDRNHLPGYVTNAEAIRAKGIDAIAIPHSDMFSPACKAVLVGSSTVSR